MLGPLPVRFHLQMPITPNKYDIHALERWNQPELRFLLPSVNSQISADLGSLLRPYFTGESTKTNPQ